MELLQSYLMKDAISRQGSWMLIFISIKKNRRLQFCIDIYITTIECDDQSKNKLTTIVS